MLIPFAEHNSIVELEPFPSSNYTANVRFDNTNGHMFGSICPIMGQHFAAVGDNGFYVQNALDISTSTSMQCPDEIAVPIDAIGDLPPTNVPDNSSYFQPIAPVQTIFLQTYTSQIDEECAY